MTLRFLRFGALAALVTFAVACQTTVVQDGVTLSDAEVAKLDEPKITINAMDERIKNSLKALDYRRGSALLHEIQFLVKTRDLAIPLIVKKLPSSTPRSQASMLYILGFTRSKTTGETLASYLDDSDGVVRYEAAAGLLNLGNMAAVPVLIGFLESEEKAFRYKAVQALRQGTGKSFGFEFSAPATQRAKSIQTWKTWWGIEKSRLMVRPAAS